jgi:hypothetical protein
MLIPLKSALVRLYRRIMNPRPARPASRGYEEPNAAREIEYWGTRRPSIDAGFWEYYAHGEDGMLNTRDLVATLEKLDLPPDFTLHEMGCNLGRNEYYIQQRFPQARLSGNDVNPEIQDRCREFFGDFADMMRFEVAPTQDWLIREAGAGRRYDVLASVAHFIHIPDDSVEALRQYVPQVVGRYLVLIESAGTHSPDSEWYKRWTTNEAVHWFDRDYTALFTDLELVSKEEQVKTESGKVYAIYVLKRAEQYQG